MTEPFGERAQVVEQSSSRAPNHRLARLIEEYERPTAIRVLDLVCAGGRNTALLAERGFDVWAVDASPAMVERTRALLAAPLRLVSSEPR
jgi:SAM-dependent methyltransferase